MAEDLVAAAAAAGAAAGLAVGCGARAIGTRLSLLDYPDVTGGRKLHVSVTPLVGGIAVALAALVGCAIALVFGAPSPAFAQQLAWFGATVAATAGIGLADDRFGLSPRLRLGLAALVLLIGASQVPDLQIDFLRFAGSPSLIPLGGYLGLAFTLICLIGFLNAVNMADGKNGLVIGQALVWSAVLAFRLPAALLPVLAALAAALAVLFIFNLRSRLFLGDSGSYGLSAAFGLLALFAWNSGFADMNADDIALIFAVPVLDTLRLIARRTARGTSPFTPGRDHLHHYLYARWGWPRPLPWVLALVAIPNAGAIAFPGTGVWWLGVTAVGYGLILAISQRRLNRAD